MNASLVDAAVQISGILTIFVLIAAVILAVRAFGLTKSNYIFLITLIAFGSMVGSLFFSEYAQWVPCNLCWWQRVWTYPVVLVGLLSLWFKESKICLSFTAFASVISLVFSSLNILVQEFPSTEGLTGAMCDANASCAVVPARALGFMTMPMMAVVVEIFFLSCVWAAYKYAPASPTLAHTDPTVQ